MRDHPFTYGTSGYHPEVVSRASNRHLHRGSRTVNFSAIALSHDSAMPS